MTAQEPGTALLVSSDDLPAETIFSGFCFCGSDFIQGAGGLAEFERVTGVRLGGGEDGRYVLMRPTADGLRISTDFWGFGKLFHYSAPGYWAVSTSLSSLIRHLVRVGRPPVPNIPVLQAAVLPGMAFQQIFCDPTIARDIALLPAGHDLVVGAAGLRVERVNRPVRVTSYAEALSLFIETWIRRGETLMASGSLPLNAALTGGRDSRTTFALLQRAAQRLGRPPAMIRVHCGAIRGDPRDLEVASQICAAAGLPINRPEDQPAVPIAPASSVAACLDNSLGVYHPLYLPQVASRPGETFWGGGGAGSYRPSYQAPPARLWFRRPSRETRFVSALLAPVRGRPLEQALWPLLMSAIAQASTRGGSQEDPLILYYRHYRNRCHAGMMAQYRAEILPLASGLLEDAAHLAGPERLECGQIIYDILHNVGPDLLEVPFDEARKAPTAAIRARLERVTLSQVAAPGKCFVGSSVPAAAPAGGRSRKVILASLLAAACEKPLVQRAFEPALRGRAADVLAALPSNGRFVHASEAIPVAAILAAGLFE